MPPSSAPGWSVYTGKVVTQAAPVRPQCRGSGRVFSGDGDGDDLIQVFPRSRATVSRAPVRSRCSQISLRSTAQLSHLAYPRLHDTALQCSLHARNTNQPRERSQVTDTDTVQSPCGRRRGQRDPRRRCCSVSDEAQHPRAPNERP